MLKHLTTSARHEMDRHISRATQNMVIGYIGFGTVTAGIASTLDYAHRTNDVNDTDNTNDADSTSKLKWYEISPLSNTTYIDPVVELNYLYNYQIVLSNYIVHGVNALSNFMIGSTFGMVASISSPMTMIPAILGETDKNIKTES